MAILELTFSIALGIAGSIAVVRAVKLLAKGVNKLFDFIEGFVN